MKGHFACKLSLHAYHMRCAKVQVHSTRLDSIESSILPHSILPTNRTAHERFLTGIIYCRVPLCPMRSKSNADNRRRGPRVQASSETRRDETATAPDVSVAAEDEMEKKRSKEENRSEKRTCERTVAQQEPNSFEAETRDANVASIRAPSSVPAQMFFL